MKMEKKQRKKLRLKDFDYSESNNVYFVTICTADKRNYFIDGEVAKLIEDELGFRKRAAKEIRLFCYCLMPDHLHVLFSLTEDYVRKHPGDSLSNWMAAFKRYTSRTANILFDIKPLWQKNYYDHVVRKEESLFAIADYILNNPVRKGIVLKWDEYPHGKMVDDLPILGLSTFVGFAPRANRFRPGRGPGPTIKILLDDGPFGKRALRKTIFY